MKLILLHIAIYLFCCVLFNTAWSDQASSNGEDDNAEEIIVEDAPLTVEQELLQLQQTLDEKEKEKKILERKLRTVKNEVTKAQLTQELIAAEDIIVGIREEIVKSATGGARVFKEPAVAKETFAWRKDLELLFQPLIDTFVIEDQAHLNISSNCVFRVLKP